MTGQLQQRFEPGLQLGGHIGAPGGPAAPGGRDAVLRPGRVAAKIARLVRCATDVTGFGLLGHLFKLASASGISAVADHATVPLIDGTCAAARAGHLPGGSRRNLQWVRPHTDAGTVGEDDLLLPCARPLREADDRCAGLCTGK